MSIHATSVKHNEKRMADTKLIRRLLRYLGKHPKLFVLALLLYPLTAVTVALPPYWVREILDTAVPARDTDALLVYGCAYVIAVVVEYVSGLLSQFAMSVLGQRSMRTLRREIFVHMQQLPASYFDRNPVGRILSRLTHDVDALSEAFATGAVTILGDMLSVLAVVGMMLFLDARLTGIAFLVVPPLLLATMVFRRYARKAFRAIRRRLATINAFLAEHLGGMSVVQLFNQQQRTAKEFAKLNADYRDSNRSAIVIDALLYAIVEAMGVAAMACILWWGASDMALGTLGAGTLIAFAQYIRRFFVPIRDLSTKYTVLQSAFAAAERTFHLLDEPLVIYSRKSAKSIGSLTTGIGLTNVWFAYKDDDWIIRDVSMHVRRGEKVALVGASGSGKTTILQLLNRTYDIQKGSVTIDGCDVRDLNLADVRKRFSVVLQDVYMFSGSVRDNLQVAPHITQADMERAANAVQIAPLIERLPHGYDTEVRALGSNFSSGERQLLAFARALACDPDMLVLDEATSHVDSRTEAKVQAAIDTLLKGRTAIVVAHRLSTIRKVDRILVMHGGQIAEEGSHEELINRGGIYHKLAQLQFGQGQL